MNENIRHDEHTGRDRRSIQVRAFGDTVEELELFALDEARAFFGTDIALEIDRSYHASPVGDTSSLAKFASGKKYVATVRVMA